MSDDATQAFHSSTPQPSTLKGSRDTRPATTRTPSDRPGETAARSSLPGASQADFPERIGDFTIVGILGQGGMGTVYLAEDTRLGRKAAVKTMRPELASKPENRLRFSREARAAAAVEHDNIVPVWQVGEAEDGSLFIAMPLLQGEMLEARLRREAIATLDVILKVGREVADGLVAAHARGLIHRDIKPGNVWLESDPDAADLNGQVRRCKILDFGLARSLGSDEVHVTACGVVLGTPAYMAPEQARGEEVDHRADLFSLGAMLYRMAGGRLPFQGPNVMAVLTALATDTPTPIRQLNPNLPPALCALIERLMSKDPVGRPQSAAEAAAAIRQIEKETISALPGLSPGMTVPANLPPVPSEEATRSVNRRRVRAALLIVLGCLALGLVGWRLAPLFLAGTTPEVTPRKDGDVTVREPPDPRAVDRRIDPDREAAAWALSIGGIVWLGGPDGEFRKADRLPDGEIRLAGVDLAHNRQVDDLGLRHFKGCKNLVHIDLWNTPVSAAGLAHFGDSKGITFLNLWGTRADDAALAHFRDCTNLNYLDLQITRVGDAGMVHLTNCKRLAHLDLRGTEVGDTGLACFKGCRELKALYLSGAIIGDEGLAAFSGCTKLTELWLMNQRATDAGLANFKECAELVVLNLGGTQATDKGIAHFRHCRNLRDLWLSNTQVTSTGLENFKDCEKLTRLMLAGTQVTRAGLLHFQGCKNLTILNLASTPVTDDCLQLFAGCKKLTDLWLMDTSVTDRGLAHFKGCKELLILGLGNTQATDTGLACFKGCNKLTQLWLMNTAVSDDGLAHFGECKSLTHLWLGGTRVAGTGLMRFQDCKGLVHIDLRKAKVSAATLTELGKILPKCKIEWAEK